MLNFEGDDVMMQRGAHVKPNYLLCSGSFYKMVLWEQMPDLSLV